MNAEIKTDVLIVGGGTGGCAAALAIAEAGFDVVLTESTDWIGGQFTSQATPPDEHGWIERFGCTRSYRRLRDAIRGHYKQVYPLTDEARGEKFFNPGNGWVSPLCCEPRAAHHAFQELLAPYISNGRVRIMLECEAIRCEFGASPDAIETVTIKSLRDDTETIIYAQYFLDATELGDLLPLANAEYVTGAESQNETGEPHAPLTAQPDNVQAFSVCFALDYLEGEDHTIERPRDYDFWREYVPGLSPAWAGKLLSWQGISPRTMQAVDYNFHPHQESGKAFSGLWTYRRIVDRNNFTEGFFRSDITIVNVPMIDYMLADICNLSKPETAKHIEAAKQQSLSFLYWMQTEAARADGKGYGWRGLHLRADVVGDTSDGLAKAAYIRESRRIKALFTVCEQHVAARERPHRKLAQTFKDSVGIGFYRIDLHPTTAGDNYIDVEALPFQIPLGALIPARMKNLLAACKNTGTTHITNGCYRLHPVEWNTGEAAGALAAFCLKHNLTAHAVHESSMHLADFQSCLVRRGVELAWAENLVLDEGDSHRHAL